MLITPRESLRARAESIALAIAVSWTANDVGLFIVTIPVHDGGRWAGRVPRRQGSAMVSNLAFASSP